MVINMEIIVHHIPRSQFSNPNDFISSETIYLSPGIEDRGNRWRIHYIFPQCGIHIHAHIGAHIDFLQNCHQFWWFPWIFANFGDFFIEIFSDSLKFSLFLVNDFSLILVNFLLGKLSPILVTFLQKILLIH